MLILNLLLLLLNVIIIDCGAQKIIPHKFYKISVAKYPALYLTASETIESREFLTPADVSMKEWTKLPEQKWKIHSMGGKYYLSSLEHDYNTISVNVNKGETSMRFVRLKYLGEGSKWRIMDMQGLCMQYKKENILRNFINRFTGDETGVSWRKCNDDDSQQWILSVL